MAKLFPFPKFGQGNQYPGGKLYTYEAGTSTPKDTFTDADEGTPNTNPVILDSNGQADVWLGSGSYKMVLDDAADVTIWTVDKISGDEQNTFAGAVVSTATTYNVTVANNNNMIIGTATLTLNLVAAVTAGEGFFIIVKNDGSGTVTIDPNGTETINGATTLALDAGASCIAVCDGSNWKVAAYYDGNFENLNATNIDALTSSGGKLRTNSDADCLTWGASDTAGVTINAELDMDTSNKIVNLADPTAAQDAVTKTYADGLIDIATQAEMEAETADKLVAADKVVFSPVVAKAWCVFDGTATGTNAPDAGYNVTNVTRNSAGNYTVNIDDNLSSGNGAAICAVYRSGGNSFYSSRLTGAGANVEVIVKDGTGSAVDGTTISVAVFGDQ